MTVLRAPHRFGLFRPSLPAAASLLVNGLLLAVLLTLGAARQERGLDDHPLNVLSLAALKGSEEGEDSASTTDPAAAAAAEDVGQPPAPPTPSISAPEPSADVPPPLPPLSSQVAQPSPPRAPAAAMASSPPPVTAPSAASSASSAPSAQQGKGATPPRRGIADGLDADAPAGKSMAYAAKVRSWLYAHKIYPRRARMRREEGVVRVRFIIDRAGVLLEGMIIGSSGKAALDEEAQAMMHRASPFPSAPAVINGDRIEFTAPIEFILPV